MRALLEAVPQERGMSPRHYLKSVRHTRWGSPMEAMAIASLYGVTVHVRSRRNQMMYICGQGQHIVYLGFHEKHYVMLSASQQAQREFARHKDKEEGRGPSVRQTPSKEAHGL